MTLAEVNDYLRVVAAGVAISSFFSMVMYYVAKNRWQKKTTLDSRVTQLMRSLSAASGLVSEIEREIQKRSELASKLQRDVKTFERLKELNAAHVEAIAQTLRGEVQRESRKSLWVGFAVNLLFFVLGSLVTLWFAK